MLKFNVPISTPMLINVVETNFNEASGLLSFGLFFYVLFFGILPIIIFFKLKNYKIESLKIKGIYISFSLLFLLLIMVFNGKNFTFLRQNREILNYLSPFNYTFNTYKCLKQKVKNYFTKEYLKKPLIPITDSIINTQISNTTNKPTLILFLIGETTRAKNINWNGYERNIMEFLETHKEDIINFPNWYSCNTSTFNSIPCMFGFDSNFSYKKIIEYENYLHILKKHQFNLYWFSNNGGCKGVCEDAIPDYKIIENPTGYDVELLKELENLELKKENTIVYLHLRGSHGTEYYKRYPESFEYYQPVCKDKDIRNCDNESIINGYDNSIRYNMFLVSKFIDFLGTKENDFNIMLFFVSDHGESLGENGFYLHAAPLFLVKETQGHPVSFLYIPQKSISNLNIEKECLLLNKNNKLTHFNIFHSITGLFKIDNIYYNSDLDIFLQCRK